MIKSLYALCLLLLLLACAPASGSGSRVASVAALTSTIEPITLVNSTVTPSAARPTEIPLESSVSPTAGGKCPVTLPPPAPFVPPAPYPPQAPYGNFWHGSEKLWLALPPSGTWAQLQFSDKMFWWRSGYSASQEPEPALTVTGRRLDGAAPPLKASRATNAYHKDLVDGQC